MENVTDKDQRYISALVKEAVVLTNDLAKMDKKMEADILKQKGALAVWWEENIEDSKVTSFVVDKAIDKAKDGIAYGLGKPIEESLKFIFKSIFKTLKYSDIAISAALAPFEASRQPSYKMAYLDSQFGNEYIKKQDRLAEIYREIFHQMPPSSISIQGADKCAIESCYQAIKNPKI